MISSPKAVAQIVLFGAIGGWLGGVCINASGGLIVAAQTEAPLKAALVGILAFLTLSLPWGWSMKQRAWWFTGGAFGVTASILAVLFYFLLWPYEGHGRDGVYKTVLMIVASYPIPVFGIGGLMGVFTSSWIRPTQDGEHLWVDWVLPVAILGGLLSIMGTVRPLADNEPKRELTIEEAQCCGMAYRAFVKKVGVSYAIFEAEKYCEVQCDLVSECLDVCGEQKNACRSDETTCKDAHRECVLACPTN